MIATTNAAGHALSAWQRLSELFIHLVPSLAIIALVVLLLWVIDRVLKRRAAKHMTDSFARPIIMLILTALAIVVVILVVPVSNDATRGQLLTLLGLVLTAIIGLSSTTFVSNAMAGFLLRSLGNVRVGDFVRVGEHFGRVSERGLFHIELQTEDRDLTTLPNFFLMSNPMTVVSASGTVISATVSIGYDESDRKVKALLLEAAERAELRDGFVHIMELGDFSITYRVAGMLADVKQILTARSRLRTAMLRTLHDAGVEIVSPTFMNTRAQQPGERAMPARGAAPKATAVMAEDGAEAEAVVFDKAERAAVLDELKAQRQELTEEVTELRSLLGQAEEGARADLEHRIERRARGALAEFERRLIRIVQGPVVGQLAEHVVDRQLVVDHGRGVHVAVAGGAQSGLGAAGCRHRTQRGDAAGQRQPLQTR